MIERVLVLSSMLLAAGVVHGANGAARAEESPNPGTSPGAGAEESATLPPVTVSARHVREDALSLPFSVSGASDADMENHHLRDAESLLWLTPGVNANSYGAPGQTTIKIRGVGALNKVSMDDGSVMLYQDGVPQHLYKAMGNLLDMNRVEVLKGPQGTLFGRNSEAGVVNLVPRRPVKEFLGSVGGEIGSRGHYLGEAVLNVPLGARWASRLALSYALDDHVYDSLADGEPLSKTKDLAGRFSLIKRGDADEILLTMEYDRKAGHLPGYTLLEGDPKKGMDPDSGRHLAHNRFLALNWIHRWDRFHFKSVSGMGRFRSEFTGPTFDERINMRLYGKHFPSTRSMADQKTQWFQEFHLASNEDAPFFWLVGANYYRSERDIHFYGAHEESPFWPMNPFNADVHPYFTLNSFAAFAETSYPVLEKLHLTAGARYSHDKTDYRNTWVANDSYKAPGPRSHSDEQSLSEGYLTGRLGLSWAFARNARAYLNLARGHKAGGFSDWDSNISQGQATSPYKAAVVDSAEIGLKADLWDKRARIEAALFHNDTKDDHVYVMPNPAVSYATVAENHDTRSRGVELDLSWKATPCLRLGAGMAYTDAVVTGKPENSKAPLIKVGNRLPDVPEFEGRLTAEYRRPVALPFSMGSGHFSAFVGWRYLGERPANPENQFDLDAHHQIDARLGLGNANFEIYAWGSNLLGERRQMYGHYIPPMPAKRGGTGKEVKAGTLDHGRRFGLGLRRHF